MYDLFLCSLFFWSFIFGLFYKSEKTKIWVSIPPKQAPPPEAFKKD